MSELEQLYKERNSLEAFMAAEENQDYRYSLDQAEERLETINKRIEKLKANSNLDRDGE